MKRRELRKYTKNMFLDDGNDDKVVQGIFEYYPGNNGTPAVSIPLKTSITIHHRSFFGSDMLFSFMLDISPSDLDYDYIKSVFTPIPHINRDKRYSFTITFNDDIIYKFNSALCEAIDPQGRPNTAGMGLIISGYTTAKDLDRIDNYGNNEDVDLVD